VDRKAILDNILEGAAVPARGLMAPGVFGARDLHLDQLYPFDRARARALLAQAGWSPGPDGVMQKGGQRLSLSYLTSRGRFLKDYEISEAAQAMLREVGIEAKIETGEWASVFTQLRSDPLKHHLYTGSWLTVNVDADATLFARYHSKQTPPGGWNNYRYANPRVDALVEQARRSVNQAERERLYGEAQDVIAREMVQVPIYNTRETVVTRAYVKGYVVHPIEYNLGLSRVWLDR
jgi:peptide/nickel transport system substrate-binding protein